MQNYIKFSEIQSVWDKNQDHFYRILFEVPDTQSCIFALEKFNAIKIKNKK